MTSWASVALRDVADVFNGKTPSKAEQRNEGHPVLKIRDVSELGKFRGKHESFVDESLAAKYSAKHVRDGDTLILNAAHNADYVGSKTYRVEPPVFGTLATGEWLIIRPSKEKLDASFVHHWVTSKSTRSAIRNVVNGIHLYPKDVARLDIALPPLPEQRRIAAILDQADALRAKRREALAQLNSLTQSIFIEMFGDPVANPKGWVLSDVGALSKLQGGLQVTTARKNLPLEIPYLRVANVYRGQLDLTEMKTIKVTDAEMSRTTLGKGDLLIVEGHGNPNEVGRSALWTGEITPCTHQNHIIRVRFDSSKILPIYACEYLNSPTGRRHLTGAGKTTSGLNTINASNVRGTPISIPPMALQQAFAKRFEAIKSLRMSHQKAMNESDSLFASLQHRAFQGEL